MNSCPHCSHNLLPHLRSHNRYWYCSHCRLETSDSFIAAQSRTVLRASLLANSAVRSLVSSI